MLRKLALVLFLLVASPLIAQEKKPNPVPSPVMTKQAVQQRLDALQKQFAQLQVDIQAVNGAIQEDKNWLAQIEAQETAAAKDKEKPKEQAPKPGGAH
jgi:TolA-binding protein